jgi:hypothetical protein
LLLEFNKLCKNQGTAKPHPRKSETHNGGELFQKIVQELPELFDILPHEKTELWRAFGILKRERYYGQRFTSRDELVKMIEDYMVCYNTKRLQRGLNVLTPWEYWAA